MKRNRYTRRHDYLSPEYTGIPQKKTPAPFKRIYLEVKSKSRAGVEYTKFRPVIVRATL